MSEPGDSVRSRTWRPERAIPMADAIDALFDGLTLSYESDEERLPLDPLPLSTGVPSLDRVLGGGVHLGTLTVFHSDLAAHGEAILLTIARAIEHPTLIDAPSEPDAAAWLLAGLARVPAIGISTGALSAAEWQRLAGCVGKLSAQRLLVSASGSVGGLTHVVRSNDVQVVVVRDAGRLGPPREVEAALVELATAETVAVVACGPPEVTCPPSKSARAVPVVVESSCLGGRATLVRVDPTDLLAVASVAVDVLSGTVSGDSTC